MLAEKDLALKAPSEAEENSVSSGNARSPSPPVRRSISTDRGSTIKSRIKFDMTDSQPKVPFPARVSVKQSVSFKPTIPSIDKTSRTVTDSQQPQKPDINSDIFNFQRIRSKTIHLENEEENSKEAPIATQSSTRRSKAESKTRPKSQLLGEIQKPRVAATLFSDLSSNEKPETTHQSDFSETENEGNIVEPTARFVTQAKRSQQNLPKISQNLEMRSV